MKTQKRFAWSGLAALVVGLVGFTLPAFGEYENFPEGEGKATLVKVCTQCHDIESLPHLRYTKAEWKNLVYSMKDMGADGSTKEMDSIVDYLTKVFGKEEKK